MYYARSEGQLLEAVYEKAMTVYELLAKGQLVTCFVHAADAHTAKEMLSWLIGCKVDVQEAERCAGTQYLWSEENTKNLLDVLQVLLQ